MMDFLRSKSNSIVFKLFFALLAFTFVAWGVGDFVTGNRNTTAIEVGSKEISVYELEQSYNQIRAAVARQFGMPQIDHDFAASFELGKRTIQNLIKNAMLDNKADELNLTVSDKMLVDAIQGDDAFRTPDGQFDREKYRQTLQTVGLTPERFEESMRNDLRRATVNDLFATDFYLDEASVRRAAQIANEKVDINTLLLNADVLATKPGVTEAEVQEYYAANAEKFQTLERRSIDVLHIDANKLMDKIQLPEEELLAAYEEHKADYSKPEQREARHILLKTEEDAKTALKRLANGEDFATVAQELSRDPGSKEAGGDLGLFSYQDMVEDFSKAAFSLEIGQVSEPVQSPFGWHIIEVTQIVPAQSRPFEDVREQVAASLRHARAEEMAYGLATDVEGALAAGKTLPDFAKENGLTVLGFDSIARDGSNAAGQMVDLPQIGADAILEAAFTQEEGTTSSAVELPDGSSVFVTLRKVTPPTQKELAAVAQDIVTILERTKVERALRDLARNIILSQQQGKTLAAAAAEHGVNRTVESYNNVARNGENGPRWLTAQFLQPVFALKEGAVYNDAIQVADMFYIVELADHKSEKPSQTMIEATRQRLGLEFAQDLQTMYLTQLQAENTIKLNKALVRQVIPSEPLPEVWFNE